MLIYSVSFSLWMVAFSDHLTMSCLINMKWAISNWCIMCEEHEAFVDHFSLVAFRSWGFSISSFFWYLVGNLVNVGLFSFGWSIACDKRLRRGWNGVPHAMFWKIWKVR